MLCIAGADPEVEEGGGGHTYMRPSLASQPYFSLFKEKYGWLARLGAAMPRAQRSEFFLCECVTHSVPGGSGGMLP